jgi:hypothetical protein
MIKRIVFWSVVIIIGIAIVQNPAGAGQAMQTVMHGFEHAGSSLATFFNSL